MSIINEISRFGASMARAHRAVRATRQMNELPIQLQRDIGWPVVSEERRRMEMFFATWNGWL